MNLLTTAISLSVYCLAAGFVPGSMRGGFKVLLRQSTQRNIMQSDKVGFDTDAIYRMKNFESTPKKRDKDEGLDFKRLMEISLAKKEVTREVINNQQQSVNPLPQGWESTVDPTSGRVYYYSRVTGETSWVPPTKPLSNPKVQTKTSTVPENEDGSQDIDSIRKALQLSQLQVKELKTQLKEAKNAAAKMESSMSLIGDEQTSKIQEISRLHDLVNDVKRESQLEKEKITNEVLELKKTVETQKIVISSLTDEASQLQNELIALKSLSSSQIEISHKEQYVDDISVLQDTLVLREEPKITEEIDNKIIQSEQYAVNTYEGQEEVGKDILSPPMIESSPKDPSKDFSDERVQNQIRGDDASLRERLQIAVTQMDATQVSSLLEAGLEMDEATTDAAFWAVVKAVDLAEEQDKPLSADVPKMLHHIFDADLRHLLSREKLTTNVTCMQPTEEGLTTHGMNYIFDDSSHKDLPLMEGRRCEGGTCCDKCSRNIFPTFATEAESDLETFPELSSLAFNDLEKVSAATILHFTRLVERVRRTIAHEYGLPLSSVLLLQGYSRKYVAGTTQQGGGGGEGDFVTLHTDEATHSGYHYSCVIYLSTQGEDFEGGAFVFNDPAKETSAAPVDYEEELFGESLAEQIRRAGREFTPFNPTRGAAVIFSSGWENMHEVEKVTSGTRYAVPCFFTTCPVPDAAYEQMSVGKPKTEDDIADDWLHLLLAHRSESPIESTGRVKELLMKWHYMCTPLSEH